MNDNKWYSSSANAEKLSLTIKGVMVAIIPVLMFVGGMFGLGIVEADILQVVEAIATFLSAGMILWGLVRKIYLKNQKV